MAQPLRVKVDNADFIYNTEAWFTASTTIWTPSQVLVPIDGADAGKHKFGNNADAYAALNFIEDGGGGGATSSDDVSDESNYNKANVTEALNQARQDIEDLDQEIEDVDTARVQDRADLEQAILDEENARTTADGLLVPKTTTVNGHALSGNVTVTKGDVGLGNVDNTSDAAKPVSTATQTALDTKGKIYSALVTTDDPVGISGAQNQLGGTPAWSADGAGLSTLTITGAFTVDKTDVQATIGLTDTPAACFCSIRRINANTVQVATFDFGGNLTALPVNVTITVRP